MEDILDRLSAAEALEVLRRLCAADSKLRERILSEAKKVLSSVNADEIAAEVYDGLGGIDVEELWDRSGASRDGYQSPEDMAMQMVEEELEPYVDKMRQYQEMGMSRQARGYCMGILKGVYDFNHKSTSEFKNWATDMPEECFGSLLDDWRRGCSQKGDFDEMDKFISDQCPDWAKWALKK